MAFTPKSARFLFLTTCILSAAAVGVFSALLIFSYDRELGHFSSETLECVWFFFLLLLLGGLFVGVRLTVPVGAPSRTLTPTDRAFSLLASVALVAVALISFSDVFDSSDIMVRVLTTVASLAALLQGGVFLFSNVLPKEACTVAPLSLFFVLYAMALYFKPLPVMNDPVKITILLAAILLSLFFLLGERQRVRSVSPRLFSFIAAATAFLSVTASLPVAAYLLATWTFTAEILSFLILILIFGIGILVRLFPLAAPSSEVAYEDNSGC